MKDGTKECHPSNEERPLTIVFLGHGLIGWLYA